MASPMYAWMVQNGYLRVLGHWFIKFEGHCEVICVIAFGHWFVSHVVVFHKNLYEFELSLTHFKKAYTIWHNFWKYSV